VCRTRLGLEKLMELMKRYGFLHEFQGGELKQISQWGSPIDIEGA
jgi:hypothetical protein